MTAEGLMCDKGAVPIGAGTNAVSRPKLGAGIALEFGEKNEARSRENCSRWGCGKKDQPFLASIHG